MAEQVCQRWRDGRDSYQVAAPELRFDPSRHDVAAIPDDTTARASRSRVGAQLVSDLVCHARGGMWHRCDGPPERVLVSYNGGDQRRPYAWCKAAQRETRALAKQEGETVEIEPAGEGGS